MAKRRGSGEGSIFRNGTRWTASVTVEVAGGRQVRRRRSARTQEEARELLRQLRAEARSGVGGRGRVSVGIFLSQWLERQANSDKSPNTIANYRWAIDKHLSPVLGTVALDKLTPDHIDQVLLSMAEAGAARNTMVRVRAVLNLAMNDALRRRYVAWNPVAPTAVPAGPTADRRSLTADEGRALLAAAVGDRLEALVVCGLMLGLRPGELTGLLWNDLDTSAATLAVTGSIKREQGPDGRQMLRRGDVKRSRAGRRTVKLPHSLVATLRAHRARQAAERLAVREQWRDHGLIFCTELGTPLDPSNVRRTFARIARRAGLDGGFPYLLRHSTASLLIDSGRSVEEVADLLGDDPRTIYRHYRHRVREAADAAVGPMEALFGAGGDSIPGTLQ